VYVATSNEADKVTNQYIYNPVDGPGNNIYSMSIGLEKYAKQRTLVGL